jgi:hypothetical protein
MSSMIAPPGTPPAGVQPGQIRTIGDIAAQNITKALSLPESATKTVETAIADEINAMSAHFTMALADVQTYYDSEVAKFDKTAASLRSEFDSQLAIVKSEFSYIAANPVKVGVAILVLLTAGFLVGHFA